MFVHFIFIEKELHPIIMFVHFIFIEIELHPM